MTFPNGQDAATAQVIPCDLGNDLLTARPATLVLSLPQTPDGQRLGVTIRTETTTLTVLLTRADAQDWAAKLAARVTQMSSSGLIVPD